LCELNSVFFRLDAASPSGGSSRFPETGTRGREPNDDSIDIPFQDYRHVTLVIAPMAVATAALPEGCAAQRADSPSPSACQKISQQNEHAFYRLSAQISSTPASFSARDAIVIRDS